MNVLLDTHLVLWAAGEPAKLPEGARRVLEDESAQLWFSVASLWEVAIKSGLGRSDFRVEPRRLRRGLVANDWRELPITAEHAVAVASLPQHHKDPFDRMLVAQAGVEGVTLMTADDKVARYPGDIRLV